MLSTGDHRPKTELVGVQALACDLLEFTTLVVFSSLNLDAWTRGNN